LVNYREVKRNNVTVDPEKTGNSRAYSIARVQSQCDAKTVAAVMAGEMSANAALVKAGLRENRQVYIPRDPSKAVEKLRTQLPLRPEKTTGGKMCTVCIVCTFHQHFS